MSETDHNQKRHFRHKIPNNKSFGYSEVLIWFRDGAFMGGQWTYIAFFPKSF
jgi:hypothetical protein